MNKLVTFKYSPEENLKRILMDKNTNYIVVEGEDDVPKYESVIKSLSKEDVDFEPVFLGGKDNIKKLLATSANKNFIAIADKDFNEHTMPVDSRLITLSRYSIENFMFCNSVLTPLVANLIKDSESNTRQWFDIDSWADHLNEKLPTFLKSIYYYQNHVLTDRKSWSNVDFYVNNSWEICSQKINTILNHLYDNNIPLVQIESEEKFREITKEQLIMYFPGKMLVQSLYKYIKKKFIDKYGNAKKLTAHIGSHNALVIYCTNLLQRQVNLRNDLNIALLFLV